MLAPSLPQVGLLAARPLHWKTYALWAGGLHEPTRVNVLMLPWLYSLSSSDEIYKAVFLLRFHNEYSEKKKLKS